MKTYSNSNENFKSENQRKISSIQMKPKQISLQQILKAEYEKRNSSFIALDTPLNQSLSSNTEADSDYDQFSNVKQFTESLYSNCMLNEERALSYIKWKNQKKKTM